MYDISCSRFFNIHAVVIPCCEVTRPLENMPIYKGTSLGI